MIATCSPGPWIACQSTSNFDRHKHYVRLTDQTGHAPLTGEMAVAIVCDRGWSESRANARLIAQAPVMYTLLRDIAEHFNCTDAPLGQRARQIIEWIEQEAKP